MKIKKNLCSCDSGQIFPNCCYPFLHKGSIPETALQLMRSRYSAYSVANIDYIAKTMSGKAAESFDAEKAKQWALHLMWCGLSIIDPGSQDPHADTDEVEFVARYVEDSKLHFLHERSQFQKTEGKWFYISGTLIPHTPQKIAHADPCPCGSRKKFSRCCG